MHLYKYLDSDTVTMQCLHVIAKMIIQLFYVVLFISFYCVSLPTEKNNKKKKKGKNNYNKIHSSYDQTILLCSTWKEMQELKPSSYTDKFHQKYRTSPIAKCEGTCILYERIVFWWMWYVGVGSNLTLFTCIFIFFYFMNMLFFLFHRFY